MNRTDLINLPPEEPRCEPSKPCVVRSRCARGIAALPKQFAKLEDFSLGVSGGTALCYGYLDAAGMRKAALQASPKRVHPPMGGGA
jgi:hypothetical protein